MNEPLKCRCGPTVDRATRIALEDTREVWCLECAPLDVLFTATHRPDSPLSLETRLDGKMRLMRDNARQIKERLPKSGRWPVRHNAEEGAVLDRQAKNMSMADFTRSFKEHIEKHPEDNPFNQQQSPEHVQRESEKLRRLSSFVQNDPRAKDKGTVHDSSGSYRVFEFKDTGGLQVIVNEFEMPRDKGRKSN